MASVTMFYKLKLLLLGETPNGYELGKMFIEDDRVESSSAYINTDDEIKYGGKNPYKLELPDLELVFEDINLNEVENPGEAEVYFETPSKDDVDLAWDIVDSTLEKLNIKCEPIYLDGKSSPFDKPDDGKPRISISYN